MSFVIIETYAGRFFAVPREIQRKRKFAPFGTVTLTVDGELTTVNVLGFNDTDLGGEILYECEDGGFVTPS